jgi:hypothetical protein
MANSRTYSFGDVQAAITGPGGTFSLSTGGVTNEGLTLSFNERVTTVWGADGEWMHSLHVAKGGSIVLRYLKTSPTNAFLSSMFNFDSLSSANTGQNVISLSDPARGDNWIAQGCAFTKPADVNYGTEGGVIEWRFSCGQLDGVYGIGQPALD